MTSRSQDFPWLKNRGYLHVTPQVDLVKDREKIISLVKNEDFIARYAFFPLIHSVIKERRYKKISSISTKRSHVSVKDGVVSQNLKKRPLHYASHLDAIIFGYYAEKLLEKYEQQITSINGLSNCVIAYRRLPIENDSRNKSTIHFAHETFSEIAKRTNNECEVLKFDIKSFFSQIDHKHLKSAWAKLLNVEFLPSDHYNLYKASTRFSYILKDDFRMKFSYVRKSGFDEKKLAGIRKKGVYSFFESLKHFRDSIKRGELKLHKYPFVNKNRIPVGIPQGLPISAVLANLYLLEFDLNILNNIVNNLGAFYRRYSDDIIVICQPAQADFIEAYINKSILDSKVEISEEKTERFLFQRENNRLQSYQIINGKKKLGVPFTYLGFEFYGNKTLIKSTNLSKFYRRMIRSVKSKAVRAGRSALNNPDSPIVLYKRRLYKLYIQYPLSENKTRKNYKKLVKNDAGEYSFKITRKTKINNSNYLSYVHRAADIMDENAIRLQLRNHAKIFKQAIVKHLTKVKQRAY